MFSIDRKGIERILIQLEEGGYLDPKLQYRFCRENDGLCLLGVGGTSYVYEMFDSLMPDRHYAVKLIGFSDKLIEPEVVAYSAQIQYYLAEQSDNIARVIALWTMKIVLDETGCITDFIGINEENYESFEGIQIQMLLMDKLDSIILKDKYGNVELVRDDLRDEAGVIKFAKQLGRAVFTVHENSFLHRDIKLENVFWDDKAKKYVLGDFGIARYVEEGGAETVVFTDGYGAPEIERRLQESYNAPADIYSFGITLYLLLNDFKFPGSDSYCASLVQYEKDFVVPAPKHASEEMARIIRKMCSYRSADRFQSVEEVLMEVGRLDGTYSEQGFKEEYEDIETEVYSDPESWTETYREDTADAGEGEDRSEIPWWEKEESELTHEERKKRDKSYAETYRNRSVIRFVVCAFLFVLFNKAFEGENNSAGMWQLWIVPVMVLVESVLQRVKEFHIVFGIVAVGIGAFSVLSTGIAVPQIALAIAMSIGIPAITAGSAAGTILWLVLSIAGKAGWLNFLGRFDLGWLVIIGLVAVVESCVLMRADYNKAPTLGERIWLWTVDRIWYWLIAVRIVLFILKHFTQIQVWETINNFHFVFVGVGIFLVEILYLGYYGLLDDDEREDVLDESMDK